MDSRTIVTDGQNLAAKAEELRKNGVTDVTVELNTINYSRYAKSHEGRELQPVIDGINAAVGQGMKIRLNVALKEGFNDDEVLDFLQLTLLHNYDIIFMPTMDYDKIKAKLPGLRPVEGDFGDIDMYKYAIAKGRIGFIK
ncbi:MAG: hypothetical protein Q4A40_06050 [Bacillota bacterium]|nr:hypothetical protein [Bacillota bacterium]